MRIQMSHHRKHCVLPKSHRVINLLLYSTQSVFTELLKWFSKACLMSLGSQTKMMA